MTPNRFFPGCAGQKLAFTIASAATLPLMLAKWLGVRTTGVGRTASNI
jgi:hypothetical protein